MLPLCLANVAILPNHYTLVSIAWQEFV